MRATVGRWRCAPRCVVGEPREEWGGRGVGGLGAPPPSQLKTTARRLVKWLALPNAVSPFLILLLSIGANGVDTSHRTKALHMAVGGTSERKMSQTLLSADGMESVAAPSYPVRHALACYDPWQRIVSRYCLSPRSLARERDVVGHPRVGVFQGLAANRCCPPLQSW